eukprot:gene12277-biopygen1351
MRMEQFRKQLHEGMRMEQFRKQLHKEMPMEQFRKQLHKEMPMEQFWKQLHTGNANGAVPGTTPHRELLHDFTPASRGQAKAHALAAGILICCYHPYLLLSVLWPETDTIR